MNRRLPIVLLAAVTLAPSASFARPTVYAQGSVVRQAARPDFLIGTWQPRSRSNTYLMAVRWNPAANRHEGYLARQDAVTQQSGYALGELCWVATPTADPNVLIEAQEVRWGVGPSSRVQWRQGTVFLARSNSGQLVTSSTVFRRVADVPVPAPGPFGLRRAATSAPNGGQPAGAEWSGASSPPAANPYGSGQSAPRAPSGDAPPAAGSWPPPQQASAPPSSQPSPAPAQPAEKLIAASPQPTAYAFIVGIEGYRDVPAATGARADAEGYSQLARRTLGLREEHIRVAIGDHATRSDILEGLKWLKENVTAGGRVYFFFSGHGAPSTDSSTYLLPYDGNPKDVPGSAVAMKDVMKMLGETKARDVLAVVDSCFSGAGGRSVLPPGARPLMLVKDAAPAAKIALFTASQGDEISGPASGGSSGAFTKFVLDGLGKGLADSNGDGQISLQELEEWVAPRVARDAKKDKREQHPKLIVGKNVGDKGDFIVEYGVASE